MVAVATLLRYPLASLIGSNLPFILLYPSILLVAWMAGLGPALFSVFLSAVSASYFFLGSSGPSKLGLQRNASGLLVFSVVGVASSLAIDVFRKRVKRLQGFEKAVEGVEDMIVVVDREYRYVIANRAFLNYRGMQREEVLGRQISDILDSGLFDATVKDKLDECFQGRIVQYEMQCTFPSRGVRDLFISYFPIAGLTGIDRVACVLRDVTEHKQADRSLTLFRMLMDQSDDEVEVVDPETLRLLDVNEKICKDLDYTREELLSLTIYDIDPSLDEATHIGILARLRNGESVVHETIHRRNDGSSFPVEISLRYVQLDRSYIVAISRDISDRKHAEAALRESEDRYRDLVEHSQDLLCTHDLEGKLLSVNPASARLLGYEVAELINSPMRDLIAPEFREQFDAYLVRIKTTGADQGVLSVVTRSGERRIWEYNNTLRTEGLLSPIVRGMAHDITARKQSEVALRESQQRLTGIIASAMDSIITLDEQQRIVLFNAAAQRMFRCSEADALGQPIERFIPQRFRAEHSTHVRTFGATEVTNRRAGALDSLWALRADGEEFQMEAAISVLEFSGKKLFTVIMRDITARKQAETRLREYERVVEGLEEMILVVDRDYRYVIANRAFLNFRGMSGDQVLGHTVEEVVGEEVFTALVREKMEECFRGSVVQYEMTYNFSNLGKRDLSVSYFPIEGRAGVERIACVLQDITERKMAEQALHKSEERFSKAFRNNPLAITISTEAEGRYLDVNDAFLDMVGYPRKDVIGRTGTELRFWGEPLDRMEMLRQLKEEERVTKHNTRYRTAKGEIRDAEVWVESIELDGQPCLLAITRDVTEMQKLEAQFRQAQKMEAVGRLAGGIAHDFNNILGIIMGYSDISLDLIAPENPASRYVAESKKAAKRAAMLTRQLLAFSRKQVVFPRNLDLNDVVHYAISMLRQLVGEDIEVEFRPAASIGSTKADPGQIEQVLMNLVVNARDAMPTGGKILIETADTELDAEFVSRHPGARAGKQVVLVVSDTGCGMEENTKAKIFEPFFTTKAVGVGTGLGLSTVYGIVKQSAGHILVYSELGKGTTFKLYFPRLSEQADTLVSSREERDPPRGSETVLVVEDDESLREITIKLLQDGGYRAIGAKDADEALRTVADSPTGIDLLLTDVIMPGTSGAELVKQVENAHPKVRALFMSGYTSDLVGRQGLVIQQDSFLEKPFTKRSLLRKVYAVLHRYATIPPPT